MNDKRLSLALRVGIILSGLLVSAPFLNPYHYYPFLTFYTEWLAFAIGLVAFAVIAAVPSRNPLPMPGMCIGLLLLTALLVLQAALGLIAYPLRSAMGALYTIWAALLVMLGAWLRSEADEARVARSLQWWLALAGVVVAATGFIQYYQIPLPFSSYVVVQSVNAMFGTVNQQNNFADYLGCALVSLAFLYARNALSALPALLMAFPVAAGMGLSGSRASWAYVLIVFALVPIMRRGERYENARKVLYLASFAFAVFLLVQILNLYTGTFTGPDGRPNSSAERLLQDLQMGAGLEGRPIRIQLFLYAWLMFLSHPLLGVGFGEFAWRSLELAADLPGRIPAGLDRHSHNLILQLLAETGIAGMLCVAVPLVSWLWRMPWRNLAPERCWALGVLAVVGLHSMIEFPLWHANFLGLFALLFGVAGPASMGLEATSMRRGLVLVIAIAGIMTAGKVLVDYRAFERWYLAAEAKSVRDLNVDKEDLESLMRLREGSVFAPYFERVASEAIELDERNLEDKLAFNTQVMRIYPMPSVVLRQIALLALSGREAEATAVLRATTRVYPQWVRQWLPALEKLARDRPSRFTRLLAFARAQLGVTGTLFAPVPGKG